jgi:uncharacterized protein (DUF885 family)
LTVFQLTDEWKEMKNLNAFFGIIILLCACSPENSEPVNASATTATEASELSESEKLNLWLDEKFEQELQFSPMSLTRLGRKELYDQIDDMSEAGQDKFLQWKGETVDELKTNFDYASLNDDAKISHDLWIYQYESDLAMIPFRRHAYVFTQMQGTHTGLPNFMINFHRVDEPSDMQAYNNRIVGISRALNQLVERAKLGAEQGVRPPRFAYETVIEEAQKLIAGAPFESGSNQDSPLWADAKKKITELEKAGKIDHVKSETVKASARLALQDHFQPAYQGLIDWMQNDLENSDEIAKGVGNLQDGKAYYNATLKRRTTLDLTADEIHNIGLQEVARIRGEMEKIKTQVEFDGSLQDFFTFVKTDPQFYYPNTDAGRQSYIDDSTAYINSIRTQLPEYFGILPKAGLVVKRVEAFREQDGAPQHYSSSSPDGSRPGVYYAHLSDMKSMPKVEMESVAYHEAIPGHHMQIAIAQELTGVPMFRTQAGFTAYQEGWGLYAERLAKEMGAYQDPYSDLGRLSAEIWRAIRLVVDTGIHSKGWSEEQAINYFLDNSPIAEGQVRAEVKRYIVWPGQATGYKIGMLKILELREQAQSALGNKFDIRTFHDKVLGGGAVPLPVLETIIDSWIASGRS